MHPIVQYSLCYPFFSVLLPVSSIHCTAIHFKLHCFVLYSALFSTVSCIVISLQGSTVHCTVQGMAVRCRVAYSGKYKSSNQGQKSSDFLWTQNFLSKFIQ